jgi:hypothetical protein
MTLKYLVLTEVKAKLIDYNLATTATMLADSILTDTIEEIESRIDTYLGFSAGIKQYVEEKVSNEHGAIFLTKYPVTSIISVNAYLPVFPSNSLPSTPTQLFEAISLWDKTNTLYVGYEGVNCRVEYLAGDTDEELLAKIQRVAFAVLRQALANSLPGDFPTLDFLDEPTADETSLSLPGGLSHSMTLGQPSGGSDKGIGNKGTAADRLFSSLSTYRRLYRL